MADFLATYGNSKIQHGKHSDRAYLMSLASEDLPGIVRHLDDLAIREGYSKVFAKVPAAALSLFTSHGYGQEAVIPGFYQGEGQAVFLGKYFCPERMVEKKPEVIARTLQIALTKPALQGEPELESTLCCRPASATDAAQMAELYRQVFATYPFPIHDEGYLQETMRDNVVYFGIWEDDSLVALASAELDPKGENAEMTDFATRPDYRGRGLASHLLAEAEKTAAQRGIKTAFTIARAYSAGMNITFARSGYVFSGTLTHNTQISGTLESMNVWYKPLQP